MDSTSRTPGHLHKGSKAGASKRKPSITRHVVDDSLTEISSGKDESSPAEDEEMLDLEPKTKENGEVNAKLKPAMEDDNLASFGDEDLTYDEDGKIILPEGTIVVEPEAVKDKDDDFHGPEFGYGLRTKFKGSIDDQIITCTACGQQVNHKMTSFVKKHPVLEVLVCRKCFNYYNSGTFSQDENGLDEYCRWCAEGGKLICCDSCHNAFCKECIRRNFGRKTLSEVTNSDNWSCFVCNPLPLQELRDFCDIVLKNSEKKSSKKVSLLSSSKKDGTVSSEDDSVAETEIACTLNKTLLALNMLRNRIQILKSKVKNNLKNHVELLHISRKFRRDVIVTKQNLKVIEKHLIKDAKNYKLKVRQAHAKEDNASSLPLNGCVSDTDLHPTKSEPKKSSTEQKAKQRRTHVRSSGDSTSLASRRSQLSKQKGIVSRRVRKRDMSSDSDNDSVDKRKSSTKSLNGDVQSKSNVRHCAIKTGKGDLTQDVNVNSSEIKLEEIEECTGLVAPESVVPELEVKGATVVSDSEVMDIAEDANLSLNEGSPSSSLGHFEDESAQTDSTKQSQKEKNSANNLATCKRKQSTGESDLEAETDGVNTTELEKLKSAEITVRKSKRHENTPLTVAVEQKSIHEGSPERNSDTENEKSQCISSRKNKFSLNDAENENETGKGDNEVEKPAAEDGIAKKSERSKEGENDLRKIGKDAALRMSPRVKLPSHTRKEEKAGTNSQISATDKLPSTSEGDREEDKRAPLQSHKLVADDNSEVDSGEELESTDIVDQELTITGEEGNSVDHEVGDSPGENGSDSATEKIEEEAAVRRSSRLKSGLAKELNNDAEDIKEADNDEISKKTTYKSQKTKKMSKNGASSKESKPEDCQTDNMSPNESSSNIEYEETMTQKLQPTGKVSNKVKNVKGKERTEKTGNVDEQPSAYNSGNKDKSGSSKKSTSSSETSGDDDDITQMISGDSVSKDGRKKKYSEKKTVPKKGSVSNEDKVKVDNDNKDDITNNSGSDSESKKTIEKTLSSKLRQARPLSKKNATRDENVGEEEVNGQTSPLDNVEVPKMLPKRQSSRQINSSHESSDVAEKEDSHKVIEEKEEKSTPKGLKNKAEVTDKSKCLSGVSLAVKLVRLELADSTAKKIENKPSENKSEDSESEIKTSKRKEKNTKKQVKDSENSSEKDFDDDDGMANMVLKDDSVNDQDVGKSKSDKTEMSKKDGSGDESVADTDELSANEQAKKKLLLEMDDSSDSEPYTPQNGGPRQKETPKKASHSTPKSGKTEKFDDENSGLESMFSDSSILSDSDTMVKPFHKDENKLSDDDSSDDDPTLRTKVQGELIPLEPLAATKRKEKKANPKKKRVHEKRKHVSSSESDIDKDLKRLSNLKSLKKKHKLSRPSESEVSDEQADEQSDGSNIKEKENTKSNKDGKKEKKTPEKKQNKNSLLFTDSDEDGNSNDAPADDTSEDEEVSFKNSNKKEDVKIDKNLNDIAKAMLQEELKSSGSENDTDMDDDVLKTKQKKEGNEGKKEDEKEKDSSTEEEKKPKTKKDGNASDSSIEEFKVVKKKKKKQDPLLKYKLSDSDSDENSNSVASSNKTSKKNDDKKGTKKGRKKGVVSDSDEDAVPTDESGSDSDESLSSLDDAFKKRKTRRAKKEEDKKKAAGKKRRRIKEVKESSDGGGENDSENDENDGTPSKGGRRKIRKIIKDSKLKDETRAAAREEEERRQRVAERQKVYNEAVVDKTKAGGPVTTKLVLDKNLETEEVLIEVHRKLIPSLKPHQVEGVKFLWDSVCESIDHMKTHPGSGCILAHCMGLGKTLQLITFIHTLLSSKRTRMRTTLVVCPLNTVLNWANEFDIWLKEDKLKLDVYELSSVKNNWGRADVLSGWHESGGVCIMGYDMFRNLVQEKGKRISKRQREIFQRTLIDPGPDLVVCDEGHILKNDATALAKAMNRITTKRRVVLTGTPLQNNLSEYHCMVHFVKPNLLGTRKEFLNRFMNPIINGQCADSTPHDFRLMKRRAHILHNLLDGCVQRRDYNVLTPFLPPKHEYVISVRLSEIQVKLYRHFLDNFARRLPGVGKGSGLFADYQALMKIWTHPYVLKLSDVREENRAQYDSDDSFIDDESSDSPSSESSTEVKCLNEPSSSKGRRTRGRGKASDSNNSGDEVINNWTTRRQRGSGDEDVPEVKESSSSKEWWTEFISEEEAQKVDMGGKLVLLLDILQECEAIGDKVLVFSQSLLSLDLIEIMLKRLDEKPEEPPLPDKPTGPDSYNSWERGLDYFRMDGSTGADMRQRWTELFNSDDNTRARLFLISTRAGGLGINLVSANRVIIFDASWNPTHDVQSIFRVYRFGQKKPVYVYRFLAQGTMEEKIYDRQISKLSLACRVVDEQQIERHFNSSDLQELYNFDPDAKSKIATPMVPKDLLLAELIIRQKDWVSGYHEHDSLLENKEGEGLTEEERKAAWAEYEAEKKGLISATAGLGVLSPTGSLDINTIIEKIQEQWPGLTQDELNEKVSHVIMWLRHQQQQQQMQAIQQQRQQQLLQQQQQQQAFLQQQQQALRQQQHYAMLNEQYRQMAAVQAQAQMRFPAVNVNPASINPYLVENRGLNVSPVTTASPATPATPAASSPSQSETTATPKTKGSGASKKDKSKK